MLKKLGLQKDHDSANVSSTSPSGSKLLDIEKMKTRHNKKVVRKTMSYDSLESESFAPEPHMPSTIYHPNPFPLDPSQPDGISRHNAFHTRHETREVETVDIEVEETKGFVSGKSRRSIDGGDHFDSNRQDHRNNYDDDAENSKVNYTIQKLGAGLKGALAKSGLGKSKDKEKEKEKENEVDAVLQYQQQQKQQQKKRLQDADITTQAQARGRERARERTQSGHIYPERLTGNDAKSPDRNREKRGAYAEHRSRLHSLSPPPTPGQERRNSDSYWPEDHRAGIHSEQMTPFIGYQPPPISPSRRQHQQYQRQTRPLSLTSDSEYGERSGRDGRYKSRERAGGVRRHSGLNQVTAAESPIRTSSELGDDESSSIDRQSRQQQVPDRLSRAKEWVANHSRNNSIAAPAPVIDREAALSSIPGALPSRSNRRYSMDPEEYGLISPPRGSYLGNAGGGYDSRERMAMMTRMKAQGQEQRDYRESMTDDGRYWSRQLEGYEYDRYRQSRVDYEYGGPGGYHGYPAGGPDDDIDDVESTLAPGSIAGVSPAKKGSENSTDASKRSTTNAGDDLEQDQLAALKPPNRKRLILRLVSLFSSLFVLLFLIAAAPVSHSSSPFSSSAGLAFHYVVAILSIIVSLAFVFNYWSRRLRRREKMKRYILFALDIIMTIAWLVDIFVCISKFPCAVGGQHGWCDMYNSSVFLAMVAFVSYLVAFGWDIWGSFDHSKIFSGPIIKPPPPGFDGKGRGGRKLASGGMGQGAGGAGGVSAPGAWPGQVPGQQQQQGQGFPMKPKNSKALW